jgi:hypothetical protein
VSSDVVFHNPVFVHPVTGRDFVANLLETVHTIFGVPTYRLRLSEGGHTMLLFDGEVDGKTLQAAVARWSSRADPGVDCPHAATPGCAPLRREGNGTAQADGGGRHPVRLTQRNRVRPPCGTDL